jgi:hypothetical protein
MDVGCIAAIKSARISELFHIGETFSVPGTNEGDQSLTTTAPEQSDPG